MQLDSLKMKIFIHVKYQNNAREIKIILNHTVCILIYISLSVCLSLPRLFEYLCLTFAYVAYIKRCRNTLSRRKRIMQSKLN